MTFISTPMLIDPDNIASKYYEMDSEQALGEIEEKINELSVKENTKAFYADGDREVFNVFFDEEIDEIDDSALGLYYVYAYHLINSDQDDEGLKYLKLAEQLNPVSYEVLLNLALRYYVLEDYDKQREYINKVLKTAYEKDIMSIAFNHLRLHGRAINDKDLEDVGEYLCSYYEGSLPKDEKYFKKAAEMGIQVDFSPELSEIVEKFANE